jgi:hypothetical protein
MMRYALLAFCAAALLTGVVSVAGDPPKLGPEWTYDEKMQEYQKTMSIRVTRIGPGQNYYFNLQHDKFRAHDADDNTSTSLTVNDSIHVEVQKGRKGKPDQIEFEANNCRYVDLNGDGVWDGWWDKRGDAIKTFIWRNSAWIEVCDSKAGFTEPRLSLDRKTEYTWDGKEWKSRPMDR